MKTLTTLFLFILLSVNALAQNVTNTLGSNGIFYIKDASNNFLTLSQSTGQVNILNTIRLEATTSSTTGVIQKGTNRFLHNYREGSSSSDNLFLGINAGNFSNTSAANNNIGIGSYSLVQLTSGYYNVAVGKDALFSLTTGYYNVCLGNNTLMSTNGNSNTALGYNAGYNTTTGSNLTLVGYDAQALNRNSI